MIVGGVVAATVGTATAIDANNKSKDAANEQKRLNASIADQEKNLQSISNPYANLTNPYANLGVATQAAEFQAEQADMALASTLDTIAATGGGAGGATALARMALESKKGISADLQQQELSNAKLRAEGEANLQKTKAEGEKWRFAQQEERDMTKLDRTQAMLDQARTDEATANQAKWQALGQLGAAAGNIAGGLAKI